MGEKVTNGTCELWSSTTDLDNWTEDIVGSGTVTKESTEVYAGTYACRLVSVGAGNNAAITQDVTLVAGNPYLVSLWHKSTSTTLKIRLLIKDTGDNVALTDAGEWESIDGASYIEITPGTSYVRYNLAFTAHASYTVYEIAVATFNNDHTSYVDNISLTDTNVDHESNGVTLADVGGSGRQVVYDSVSIKDDFKYYLASSEGKIFTYSGDYLSDDGSVILSRWRSKTLDFSDQIPQCLDRMKEVTGVKLIYKDMTTSTNVTVYVSSDGGATWEHETKSLGTGTGEILSATYHFIKTGEYFIFAIEHASTDKEFMWLRMEADVVPLGPYIEI
ncbi:hypothetical protein LCGC14_1036700 [marine sediment metagenome]|uniref:Uncharacterized protein n=1 Tax=marine sediment metagenome TaxID=412755 RepID=A0A0F9QB82_9ZZZZ